VARADHDRPDDAGRTISAVLRVDLDVGISIGPRIAGVQ